MIFLQMRHVYPFIIGKFKSHKLVDFRHQNIRPTSNCSGQLNAMIVPYSGDLVWVPFNVTEIDKYLGDVYQITPETT